jgi:hypothetical protein
MTKTIKKRLENLLIKYELYEDEDCIKHTCYLANKINKLTNKELIICLVLSYKLLIDNFRLSFIRLSVITNYSLKSLLKSEISILKKLNWVVT